MKVKKTTFILLFLCTFLPFNSIAQYSTKNKKAIEYFRKGNVEKDPNIALEWYKKAYEKDSKFVEAAWKLSDSYAELFDETNQINVLKKTIEDPKHPRYQSCVGYLARVYFETGHYEESLALYKLFPESFTAAINRCLIGIHLKKNPIPFDPVNMTEINTEYDDYWPNISADGLSFSTTVLVGKLPGKRISYSDQEDIYRSELKKDGKWSKSEPLGPPIQTKRNEGSQSFSLDGKYMFFVACDRKNSVGGCDIYYSIKDGNTWGEAINPGMPLNSKDWESTPSFSADGNDLYFASSRKGTIGGHDIWRSTVSQNYDGTLSFSEPINMGENINTIKDERSPFIHPDNQTLYFSSEGHYGMGKFDVFFSRKDAYGNWSQAQNLGYPLNSHRSEIGFVVNSKGDKAYFSSNGIEKNGRGMDIYEAFLDERLRPKKVDFFIGKIVDDSTLNPLEAHIEIFRVKNDEVISKSMSNKETGKCILRVPSTGDEYGYNVTCEGYLFHSDIIYETNTGQETLIRLKKATAGSNLVLNNVFFATNSFYLEEKSKSELNRIFKFLSDNPNIKVQFEGHTDSQGSRELNTKLSDNRAKAVRNYLIEKGIEPSRMKAVGYGPDRPVADNYSEEGRAQNRRTEMIILE
jgi:outer membrane protein OmpA-like peptidoglycan-associated protein